MKTQTVYIIKIDGKQLMCSHEKLTDALEFAACCRYDFPVHKVTLHKVVTTTEETEVE